MFGKITKAVERLADALYGLTAELALIRKAMAGRQAEAAQEDVKGIDVADAAVPDVSDALIFDETPGKRKWTDREVRFVNECLRSGMSPSTIQRGLHELGYDRTLSAVKHKVDDYRNATKPLKM